MTALETIIIAIVEGLTEFLPVSSTGHMIITQNLLGVESTPFVKAFTIIIQFGAILSVVCLYWNRFFRLNHQPAPAGSTPLQAFLHKWDFYWKLLVAFIPAIVIGFLGKMSGLIDRFLENVEVVAVMLVVGGIFMLFCDRLFNKGSEQTKLTEARAFRIGLFQCIDLDTMQLKWIAVRARAARHDGRHGRGPRRGRRRHRQPREVPAPASTPRPFFFNAFNSHIPRIVAHAYGKQGGRSRPPCRRI